MVVILLYIIILYFTLIDHYCVDVLSAYEYTYI